MIQVGGRRARPPSAERTIDLGDAALLPGLVNAHTHLELSNLRGQVAPAASVPGWVRDLLARRGSGPADAGPIRDAIREAHASGTILVGDVANTLATARPLAEGPIAATLFLELIGFNAKDPTALVQDACRQLTAVSWSARLRPAVAAHAPYSVAPALFRAIRTTASRERWPTSVHLAESEDETVFLDSAGGSWRALLEELGAWAPDWQPPRSSPVEYLERHGFFEGPTLAVHGVHLDPADLSRLATHDVTLVTCPRSNAWTGAGRPPVGEFFNAPIRVAVGTDSLASCPDLNMFAELAALRRSAPAVPASRLLRAATRDGATALGYGAELGSIEAGKWADLVAVDVGRQIDDVEEYLVNGIAPSQVRWLEACA